MNMAAARIGPTVWELDGPMPILKSSNTLIAMMTPWNVTAAMGSAADVD
jgi:hypothetical protein